MKKILLTALTVSSLISVNAFAEDTKTIAEDTKIQEAANAEPTVFNEKNVASFLLLEKTETNPTDKKADKILSRYHKDFLKMVKSINKNIDSNVDKINSDIDSNIKQGVKVKSKILSDYDANCGNPQTEAEHEECQKLKSNAFDIEEQVRGIENERKNILGEIETERANRLNKVYVQYKNMVGSLLSQVKANQ